MLRQPKRVLAPTQAPSFWVFLTMMIIADNDTNDEEPIEPDPMSDDRFKELEAEYGLYLKEKVEQQEYQNSEYEQYGHMPNLCYISPPETQDIYKAERKRRGLSLSDADILKQYYEKEVEREHAEQETKRAHAEKEAKRAHAEKEAKRAHAENLYNGLCNRFHDAPKMEMYYDLTQALKDNFGYDDSPNYVAVHHTAFSEEVKNRVERQLEYRNRDDGGYNLCHDKDLCFMSDKQRESPMNYWDRGENIQYVKQMFEMIFNEIRESDERGVFDEIQLEGSPVFRRDRGLAGKKPHLDFYGPDTAICNNREREGVGQLDLPDDIKYSLRARRESTAKDWKKSKWPKEKRPAKCIVNVWIPLDGGKALQIVSEKFCEFKSHQLVNPMDTENPDAWHNWEPTHITCLDATKENYEQFTRHMIQSPPGAIVIFVSQSDEPKRQPRCWHCAVFNNSKYEIDDETNIQTPIQTPSLEARGSVPRKKNIFQSIW